MAPIDVELFMEHTRKRSIVEVLLRGHLWLENALIELIEAEVANPVPLKLDRMTFANKANLAEALGLLGSTDAGTLRALNKIRNRLAHDLHGEPTLDDLVLLERGLSQSQTDLAGKLSRADVSRFGAWPADSDHLVRLGMTILALLAEIEMHRQRQGLDPAGWTRLILVSDQGKREDLTRWQRKITPKSSAATQSSCTATPAARP